MILSFGCKAYYDIFNRLDVTHKRDGQTDGQIANAALHCVVRPKAGF